MSRKLLTCGLAGLVLAALAPPAFSATAIDLTTPGASATGTVYGGVFTTNFTQPAGSGVIGSFLRVQNSPIEMGYNTDTKNGNSLPFDDKAGVSLNNGDVRVSDLHTVTVGGKAYVPFLLDIDENNVSPDSLISLDRLTIYVGTPHQNAITGLSNNGLTGDVTGIGTKVYDMDTDFGAPPDQYIKLDNANAPGSGKFNMLALIPANLFNGFADTQAVYLFNVFGVQYTADAGTQANAGFEEWSLGNGGPRVIPLPPVALAGVMALGLWAGAKRLRRRTA